MKWYYGLRLSLKDVSVDVCIGLLKTVSCASMHVLEGMTTDNPHVQSYIETELKQPALRVRIRNVMGKGNRAYSLKEMERYPIEYLSYIMKEDPNPVWRNIPDEVVSEANEYQEEYKKSRKKKKEIKVLDVLLAQCQEEKACTVSSIYDVVVDYHLNNSLLINDFRLKSYIQTLMFKLNPIYRGNHKRLIVYDLSREFSEYKTRTGLFEK